MKGKRNSIINGVLMAAVTIVILASCAAPNVVHLKDIQDNVTIALQEVKEIRLKPGDRVRVYVFSRDRELTEMFNLGAGQGGQSGSMTVGNSLSYTITEDGNIEMPILGPIHAEGLTRIELANTIKYKLLAGKLVRDPNVVVDYANLCFYTLGAIGTGRHEIADHDHINLLEAISLCGDINLMGRHDNVLVLRTENGKQTPYRVDFTSTESVYSSPVFYLQQNDIIYVEPNHMLQGSTTPTGNMAKTPYFWISMVSLATSVVLFFVKK